MIQAARATLHKVPVQEVLSAFHHWQKYFHFSGTHSR